MAVTPPTVRDADERDLPAILSDLQRRHRLLDRGVQRHAHDARRSPGVVEGARRTGLSRACRDRRFRGVTGFASFGGFSRMARLPVHRGTLGPCAQRSTRSRRRQRAHDAAHRARGRSRQARHARRCGCRETPRLFASMSVWASSASRTSSRSASSSGAGWTLCSYSGSSPAIAVETAHCHPSEQSCPRGFGSNRRISRRLLLHDTIWP